MNDLNEAIEKAEGITKDYLKMLKGILEKGGCNACKKMEHCEYAPEIGEIIRCNCPYMEVR